jgi:hypothetical protein
MERPGKRSRKIPFSSEVLILGAFVVIRPTDFALTNEPRQAVFDDAHSTENVMDALVHKRVCGRPVCQVQGTDNHTIITHQVSGRA